MKTSKLLFIITFMVFGTGNIFAQNNDMKARIEYEDAETAYSNQNYGKAVEHLENAERFLGKATAKTRYLLILSLSKNLSKGYEYKDLEKLRKLSKHYLDNYTTTDTDKYREIYDLSNNLDRNYPKSLAEYNKLKQEKEEQQKRLSIEKREREELERVEKIKKGQKYVLDLARKYNFQPNLTLSEFAALSRRNQKFANKVEKKIKKSSGLICEYDNNYLTGFTKIPQGICISKGKVVYYKCSLDADSREHRKRMFDTFINDVKSNLEAKYYTITYDKIIIKIPNIGIDICTIDISDSGASFSTKISFETTN